MLILLFVAILFSVSRADVILKTTFQDAPPKYYRVGRGADGICYRILEELNRRLEHEGIRIVWDGRWRTVEEVYQALREGEIDVFVCMASTQRRRRELIYSPYPLYGVFHGFAFPKEFLSRSPSMMRVAVPAGTRSEEVLERFFSFKVVPVRGIGKAVELLKSGGADALFYNSMSLGYLLDKKEFSILLAPTKKYYHYVVYRRGLPQDVIEALDRAVRGVVLDGVVERIVKDFGISFYVQPASILKIALGEYPKHHPDSLKGLREAFERLGFEVEFVDMNLERAKRSLELGLVDGVAGVRGDWKDAGLLFPRKLCTVYYGFARGKGDGPCGRVESLPFARGCFKFSSYRAGVEALDRGRIASFAGCLDVVRDLTTRRDLRFRVVRKENLYLILSKDEGFHRMIIEQLENLYESR